MQDVMSVLDPPPEIETLERVAAADIIRAWRQDFGIDVAHLFEGVDEVTLRLDPRTGQMRFEPCSLGDAAFYQALREFKWYHPARKLEHVHAAELARAGGLVLDIGAGNGDFAGYLAGADYVGLESDPDAVATGRASGIDLRPLDMATWRASDEFRPAHLVTAFQVLEHVEDPGTFLSEMKNCLADDGTIMIGVPDAESYVSQLPDFMLNAPPHHVSWWTETALRQALETAGLAVHAVKRFPVEPWEYQLWWMAKFARWMAGTDRTRFGRGLRARKVLSFCLSWPLQWLAPPKSARGSTLLIEARKAGG